MEISRELLNLPVGLGMNAGDRHRPDTEQHGGVYGLKNFCQEVQHLFRKSQHHSLLMCPAHELYSRPLSPPTPPGSSALCLHASPFIAQVTFWAPSIFLGGHSGYMMIKTARKRRGADLMKSQPTQTQGAVEKGVY